MKNMTEGSPSKLIILFTIPLILGNILQQLYNIGDSKIVSMFIDEYAFAAVGMTAVVTNAIIGFLNGFTQGFGILVANSFGAGSYERLRRNVAGSIMLCGILAITLTILGLIFIRPLLLLLNTPIEVLPTALKYVRIVIAGIIFTALYNLCANILRAVGDSTTPLIFLIMSVVINLVMDFLLVGVFKIGIEGAAIATVIAQLMCSVGCVLFIFKKYKQILPTKNDWSEVKGYLTELFTTGLSMGLMGCIVNIGTITLQGAINGLGPDIMAAHVAGRRLLDLMMVMIFTYGFAMTTYVSQNVGARKIDRVIQGVKAAVIIVTIISTVLLGFCFLFSKGIVTWIASTENETIISNGVMYARTGVCFFYALGPLFILRCTLQGLGHKIVPLFSSILELVLKILSVFFLVPAIGYFGVALTEPISWVLMTTMLLILYVVYIKKDKIKFTTQTDSTNNK